MWLRLLRWEIILGKQEGSGCNHKGLPKVGRWVFAPDGEGKGCADGAERFEDAVLFAGLEGDGMIGTKRCKNAALEDGENKETEEKPFQISDL